MLKNIINRFIWNYLIYKKKYFPFLDFMPVPVSPMTESAEGGGDLKQEPRCLEEPDAGTGTDEGCYYENKTINIKYIAFVYSNIDSKG